MRSGIENGRLGAALTATAAIALLLPAAQAVAVVPPDNSAVNQYTETYPTGGGGQRSEEGGDRSPGQALGERSASRLQALGPQGRAAAQLAAETAPGSRRGAGSGGGAAAPEGGGQGSDGGDSGSSGGGFPVEAIAGSSEDGATILMWAVIVATVLCCGTFAWAQSRRA